MRRFLVEYLVPGAGQLSAVELDAIVQQWRGVLATLGPGMRLLATSVTEHAMYSLYLAREATLIHQHACLAGLPANHIRCVTAIIAPAADAPAGVSATGKEVDHPGFSSRGSGTNERTPAPLPQTANVDDRAGQAPRQLDWFALF